MFRRLLLGIGMVAAIFLLPVFAQGKTTAVHQVIPAVLAVQADSMKTTSTDSVQSTSPSTIAVSTDSTAIEDHRFNHWGLLISAIIALAVVLAIVFVVRRKSDDFPSTSKKDDYGPGNSGRRKE